VRVAEYYRIKPHPDNANRSFQLYSEERDTWFTMSFKELLHYAKVDEGDARIDRRKAGADTRQKVYGVHDLLSARADDGSVMVLEKPGPPALGARALGAPLNPESLNHRLEDNLEKLFEMLFRDTLRPLAGVEKPMLIGPNLMYFPGMFESHSQCILGAPGPADWDTYANSLSVPLRNALKKAYNIIATNLNGDIGDDTTSNEVNLKLHAVRRYPAPLVHMGVVLADDNALYDATAGRGTTAFLPEIAHVEVSGRAALLNAINVLVGNVPANPHQAEFIGFCRLDTRKAIHIMTRMACERGVTTDSIKERMEAYLDAVHATAAWAGNRNVQTMFGNKGDFQGYLTTLVPAIIARCQAINGTVLNVTAREALWVPADAAMRRFTRKLFVRNFNQFGRPRALGYNGLANGLPVNSDTKFRDAFSNIATAALLREKCLDYDVCPHMGAFLCPNHFKSQWNTNKMGLMFGYNAVLSTEVVAAFTMLPSAAAAAAAFDAATYCNDNAYKKSRLYEWADRGFQGHPAVIQAITTYMNEKMRELRTKIQNRHNIRRVELGVVMSDMMQAGNAVRTAFDAAFTMHQMESIEHARGLFWLWPSANGLTNEFWYGQDPLWTKLGDMSVHDFNWDVTDNTLDFLANTQSLNIGRATHEAPVIHGSTVPLLTPVPIPVADSPWSDEDSVDMLKVLAWRLFNDGAMNERIFDPAYWVGTSATFLKPPLYFDRVPFGNGTNFGGDPDGGGDAGGGGGPGRGARQAQQRIADEVKDVEIVIVRPNIEHYMLGIILGKGGENSLGSTFWGQTELSCYDDSMHGIWGMSYKYHSRAMVLNEKNLVRLWDVAYDGYTGGKDDTWVNWTKPNSVDEFVRGSMDVSRSYRYCSLVFTLFYACLP
jgi:hypothetical protein